MSTPRRIAWIGTPGKGGVGGMCHLFLRELGAMDLSIDVYLIGDVSDFPDLQAAFSGAEKRFIKFPFHWNWNSWYGRNRKAAFLMNFMKRLPIYGRLVNRLVAEHRRRPYDAVIQFSQGELFGLGRYAGEIPIILYPCVHAAGEQHWCGIEESLARMCEPVWWRLLRNQYLGYRSRLQKRDYHRARGVIGMSERFNRCVKRDYDLQTEHQGVVYHPIERPEIKQSGRTQNRQPGRVRLLFVGRISVRKGIEMVVAAMPCLLEDPDVEVAIIGAGAFWSNYEPLLSGLSSERCKWLKSMPNDQVNEEMSGSDILLVPSHYEPGGIVVGEALANGMIVVASDEVGSAENLPESVCKEFKAGDAMGFLDAVRRAVGDVRLRGQELRDESIKVARDQFDPSRIAGLLLSEIDRLLVREGDACPV